MQLCSSDEEANAIAEALADQDPFEESVDYLQKVADSFLGYFDDDLLEIDIKAAVRAVAIECWGYESHIISYAEEIELNNSDDKDNDQDKEILSQSDSDDDGEMLREGECELCERTIKLTRHHLIPKSTWPRMKKKLWQVASEIESYHCETDVQKLSILKDKIQKTTGIRNPAELPTAISHATIRNYLSQVCSICRPCHSTVHRIHDEWELATEFHTIDQLLECTEIRKFAMWANKQRPGKYSAK